MVSQWLIGSRTVTVSGRTRQAEGASLAGPMQILVMPGLVGLLLPTMWCLLSFAETRMAGSCMVLAFGPSAKGVEGATC